MVSSPVALWQWWRLEGVQSQPIPAQGFLQQVIFARGSPVACLGLAKAFSEPHNKQSPSLPAKPSSFPLSVHKSEPAPGLSVRSPTPAALRLFLLRGAQCIFCKYSLVLVSASWYQTDKGGQTGIAFHLPPPIHDANFYLFLILT